MELGGAYGVRAYPEGEAFGDTGYIATTEARLMLDMAESMLESGAEACELSARSCMNEAIEWLEPTL